MRAWRSAVGVGRGHLDGPSPPLDAAPTSSRELGDASPVGEAEADDRGAGAGRSAPPACPRRRADRRPARRPGRRGARPRRGSATSAAPSCRRRAQRADQLPGLTAGGGIEPGRRLVEEQQLGSPTMPDGQVEPAPLPTGEVPHPLVELLAEPDQVDALGDGAPAAVAASRRRHHLGDASARARPPTSAARCRCGRGSPGRRGRVVTEHADVTRGALAVALEDLHGGRLARAVGPEQGVDLTLVDVEATPRRRPRSRRSPCAGRAR